MKLASWNINSVRLRQALVLDRLQGLDLDVLCLQETKTEDQFFPVEAFADAGWPHIVMRGEKSYNGVAIISRLPITDSEHHNWTGRTDCRHISATIDGQTIHNFYVPAGGDEPDRTINPKFGHKLDFIDEMTAFFTDNPPASSILVGDLNIAPLEADVWSSRQLRNVVSHTDIEREKLLKLIMMGLGRMWCAIIFGTEEILYSWWSYRARDWAASNFRGRRLDHVWVSTDNQENHLDQH